ncbi:MAG: 4-(cytidine 5'-diphospho)-2-C-methyl-D-erythritol kinase [Nitrospirota bacterium]
MKEPQKIKIKAPAKVNFYLEVVGKRPDSYHDLVSLMQALDLSDELTFVRTSGGISVECDSPSVPAGPGNIVHRAAKSVMDEAGAGFGLEIKIEKRIPVAAGLGGGSSDAAATLRAVNRLAGHRVPEGRLKEMALTLGADVPFFLGSPCAVAEGVGERLHELPAPEETWLLLINPGFAVSTRWVYSNLNFELTNRFNNINISRFEGQAKNARLLARHLHNDLERVTVVKYPLIKVLKERLVDEGALGALMSGSGPTVFGVFEDKTAAEVAARRFDEPGLTVLVTKTIMSWPSPQVSALDECDARGGAYGGDGS